MTPEIYRWCAEVIQRRHLWDTIAVVEVGSHNRHPRTEPGGLRPLFMAGEYVGVDLEDGPGVDIVMSSHDMKGEEWARRFSVAICTEVLEHDPWFWLTLKNINQSLVHGGYFILSTCDNGFPRHDYPGDYYRFSVEALERMLDYFGFKMLESESITDSLGQPSVMALGVKEYECEA